MEAFRFSIVSLSVLTLSTALPSGDGFHPDLPVSRNSAKYESEDASYWMAKGKEEIKKSLKEVGEINTNVAKNVILFIGDGMSLPTVYATRVYKAQYKAAQQNREETDAEGSLLTFEQFPNTALIKTFCIDQQTPDSSCTASAIFSGVKTIYSTMGFDNSVIRSDIDSHVTANKVDNIMKWAQDAGKDTGFVTTARVSHATPGSLYSHSANRGWECDADMPDDKGDDAHDITLQLVTSDPGRRAKVIFGGGWKSFLPKQSSRFSQLPTSSRKFDYDDKEWDCYREDGKDLIEQFMKRHEYVPGFEGTVGKLLHTREELLSVKHENYDYFLGLFAESFMDYEDRRVVNNTEPSLTEMTRKAIEILKKNENGFFLMVEGSNIDHSHHGSRARQALHETMTMDDAVEAALEMVDLSETLIIVTADHGHTMSHGGYQSRGHDVAGLVDFNMPSDRRPYVSLNYGNGKGFHDNLMVDKDGNVIRPILTQEDVEDFSFHNPSPVPMNSETHGGEDVGIYAKGPYSHLFKSVHDQSFIAQVMAYSACIGPHKDDAHCAAKENGGAQIYADSLPLMLVAAIYLIFVRNII